jgi:capsule polysaccharide export protein KpsE/RkpR
MVDLKAVLDHVKDVLQKDADAFDSSEWQRIQQGLMFKDGKFVDEMVYKNVNTGEIKCSYHEVTYLINRKGI